MDISKHLDLLPNLVIHADWSINPQKRVMTRAVLDERGFYKVNHPEMVADLASFFDRLRSDVGPDGCVLIGVDFPIGLPFAYASHAGITNFMDTIPRLGQIDWSDFYQVAETPDQIRIRRPFYPKRPGSALRSHLLDGLGLKDFNELFRLCDHARPGRRAACPLFWTLGSQQVGKAAISGWKGVLGPALQSAGEDGSDSPPIRIWPFSGTLPELIKPQAVVVTETYPAEFYSHFSLNFTNPSIGKRSGKRDQSTRAVNSAQLLSWIERNNIQLDPLLHTLLNSGFGPSQFGEDLFDATIGLFGMLNILLGNHPLNEPDDPIIRLVEGWIFGQHLPKDHV